MTLGTSERTELLLDLRFIVYFKLYSLKPLNLNMPITVNFLSVYYPISFD